KNHPSEGCFSEHVLEFSLLAETGEIAHSSRTAHEDKLCATIGGMRLPGPILSAKRTLTAIETRYIRQERIKAENLYELFRLFDESENWTYNVAWIDCLQKGKNIGKSILIRGEHAFRHELTHKKSVDPLHIQKKNPPAIPFFFPEFFLNSLTVRFFNWFYYAKQTTKKINEIVDYERFFYPLDVVENWNKIYGKKGFIQYQMVIPKENGKEGMRKILETIAEDGSGSFLAVLKLFGKNSPQAYNSFPMEGYTLALDFRMTSKLKNLVQKLDEIVEQYGGRIYLSKDVMSKPS